MYSRPGYGTSTSMKGRLVADAASDTAAVLDALGYGADAPFVTVGWSGGGPHALACVALLAERCLGGGVIAGVAPADSEDLAWTAGMGQENVEEFEAARVGGQDFEALLGLAAEMFAGVTEPAVLVDALGGLITEADKEALVRDGIADYMIGAFRQAVLHGTDGWRDDDVAFLTPWGFDPATIERPVWIWQGSADQMVPADHARVLAARIGSAHLELRDGEGHLSIVTIALPALLDDLAALVA
jgi:pimeloyl-ACP methyl ester carboxylesterase